MDDSQLNHLVTAPALEMVSALREGAITAAALTEAVLARIEDLDGRVHAFVHVAADRARAQAREADERLAAGDDAPLLGVPVPIKDLNMVAGLPMQAGSAAMAGFVAPVDDGIVTRLAEAGTIMIGKTATPELGLPPYTETDIAPPPANPWDPTRSPGGSSGGAGAAVAARLVPIAQGSDGGGSIRIPAGTCGLVGLKPSRGRISTGPNGVDGPGLGTAGVLTRTVADTAVALDILARPWPGDDRDLARPAGGYLKVVTDASHTRGQKLRIGVLTDPIIGIDTVIHPEALAAVDIAVAALTELGHEITAVPVPFTAEEWDPFLDVWSVMAAGVPLPPEAEAALVPLSRWMRERGRGVSGITYAAALSAGQMLQRKAAVAWADVDLVLTPTLAGPPAKIGAIRNDADPATDFLDQCRYTPWTSTFNILGAPAISLPLHWAVPTGGEPIVPFGIQLAARTGREDLLLDVAARLERLVPWRDRVAPLGA